MAKVYNPDTGLWEDDGAPGPIEGVSLAMNSTPAAAGPEEPMIPGQPMTGGGEVMGAPIVRENKNVTTSTNRPIVTPGFKAAKSEIGALGEQQVEQARQEGAANLAVLEERKRAADAEAMARAEHAKQQAELQARIQADVSTKRERIEQEEAKQAALEAQDPKEREYKNKTLGVIATLISGIGASMQGPGAVNQASARLDKIAEREEARYKLQLQQQEKKIGRTRQYASDAQADGDHQLELLKARGVSVLEQQLAEAKSHLADVGMKNNEIETNALVLDRKAKLAEKKLSLEQMLTANSTTTVTKNTVKMSGGVDGMGGVGGGRGPDGRPLTGPQADAAAGVESIATDMEKYRALNVKWTDDDLKKIQDNTNLTDATQKTAEDGIMGAFGAKAARMVGLVPRGPLEGLPQEKVQAYQALDRMRQQVLKAMTGAGVTNAEQVASRMNFLPQAGDTPEVMESKFRASADFARANAIKAGSMRPDLEQRLNGLVNFKQPDAAPKAAQAAGGAAKPAADARRATHPKHGPGWFYGGEFHPDGGTS